MGLAAPAGNPTSFCPECRVVAPISRTGLDKPAVLYEPLPCAEESLALDAQLSAYGVLAGPRLTVFPFAAVMEPPYLESDRWQQVYVVPFFAD